MRGGGGKGGRKGILVGGGEGKRGLTFDKAWVGGDGFLVLGCECGEKGLEGVEGGVGIWVLRGCLGRRRCVLLMARLLQGF